MTEFIDGPAAGRHLTLRRSPLFLRVVRSPGNKIDALDQIDDRPDPGETVHVYLRVSTPTRFHLSYTEGGRRKGGWFSMAKYALHDQQPDEATLRDNAAWQDWCWQQKGRPA